MLLISVSLNHVFVYNQTVNSKETFLICVLVHCVCILVGNGTVSFILAFKHSVCMHVCACTLFHITLGRRRFSVHQFWTMSARVLLINQKPPLVEMEKNDLHGNESINGL